MIKFSYMCFYGYFLYDRKLRCNSYHITLMRSYARGTKAVL